MKIDASSPDDAVLRELGARLAAARLAANLTQSELAAAAGISKRTLERLETGQVATQLSGLIRVCRALGLLGRLDAWLPAATRGPLAELEQQGRNRQRASARRRQKAAKPWTWGDS